MLKHLAALLVMLIIALPPVAFAQDQPSEEQKMELFRRGAQLWPVYCNHCHNARDPSEFAPYQWDAIMMHMRTQENMTAQDARALLEFLKHR